MNPFPLPDPGCERRILHRMFLRQTQTVLCQTFSTARFRLFTIVLYSVILWGFLFGLACGGFKFLHTVLESVNLYEVLVRALIGLFFVVIFGMLSFSTAILMHSFLFRASDVPLLMTLPLRAERIFLLKMDQAQLLAGWAFMLSGSSILGAMGVIDGVPWTYYPYMIGLLVIFTQICTAVGAILSWLLLRFFPLHRIPWIFGGAMLVGIVILVVRFLLPLAQTSESDMASLNWIQNIFGRFRGFENRFMPTWWATAGLLRSAAGNMREAMPFLGLLLVNAMFLRMIAGLLAGRWYRNVFGAGLAIQTRLAGTTTAFAPGDTDDRSTSQDDAEPFTAPTESGIADSIVSSTNGVKVSGRSGTLPQDDYPGTCGRLRRMGLAVDRVVAGAVAAMRFGPDVQAMILKDWKLFRREPGQWGQIAIALGLVGMYLVNVRRMHFEMHAAGWTHFIGMMNMLVVGLLLSTSATRFVYPLVSQEGAHFSTLTQLPLHRDRLLLAKYFLAVLGTWLPAAMLILTGDLLFMTGPTLALLHQVVGLAYATGLSGIAVGLGASYPDLREVSSAKVASGFGGTLNLVLGASYVLLLLGFAVVPSHLVDMAAHGAILSVEAAQWVDIWRMIGLPLSALLAIIAGIVPVRIGMRRFRNAEF